MPFSTFYAPIVKLILCQRPSGILPSTLTHSNPFSLSSMASLSVDGPAKSLFLWTIVNSWAWRSSRCRFPHKTPSSNILWAALLKIDNASCSKYFIREVSQSWSQQSCQALGAMLQSARTKFFCSDNYQATSCWDLFPVEILGNCNQSTRVKLIVTSEGLPFELSLKLRVISKASDSIYVFFFVENLNWSVFHLNWMVSLLVLLSKAKIKIFLRNTLLRLSLDCDSKKYFILDAMVFSRMW